MRCRLLALAAPLGLLVQTALPVPTSAATLDVMSYNINWGAPDGRRLDDVARVIARSGADVAGLQQVRRFARNAKKGNYRCDDQPAKLAAMLRELTGERWYWSYAANTSHRQSTRHCRAVTSKPRQEGVAVVSRYPIVSAASYRLPYQRGLVKATVRAPGGRTVTVYAVHLDSLSAGRRAVQARDVARIVAGTGGPVFLAGDMNSPATGAPVRMLARVARDSWAEKRKGAGATRNGRIDYVFYRGGVRLESVRVIRSSASDHRPVLAGFVLE